MLSLLWMLHLCLTWGTSELIVEPKDIPSISTILRDELHHPLAFGNVDSDDQTQLSAREDENGSQNSFQNFSLPDIKFTTTSESRNYTPYGLWSSDVDAGVATQISTRPGKPPVRDTVTGSIFWLENQQDGRDVLIEYNEVTDLATVWTPREFNVRTTINYYGGGSFTVCNNTVIFSNKNDNALYIQKSATELPRNLTEVPSKRKFGDLVCVLDMGIVMAVGEDPAEPNSDDPIKTSQMVVFVNLSTGEQQKNLYHTDFFQSPRFSPDRTKLAWIERSAPYMPWDDNTVFQASVEGGQLIAFKKMLQHGSSMMIGWTQYNEMLYVHDSSDWWNLYIINKHNQEINLTPFSADVGGPAWELGQKTYDVNPSIGSRDVAVAVGKNLLIVNSQTQERRQIKIEYDSIFGLTYSQDGSKIYMVAANGTEHTTLIQVDSNTGETTQIRRRKVQLPRDAISVAHNIAFPTSDNGTSYGNLYLPRNPHMTAEEGSLPPLLVNVHGGPTSSSTTFLKLPVQYFTNRGFAFFDLDYRGSSGYGREYIKSLYGKWGVYDVDDAIAGAKFLIKEGLVDAGKIAITGGSAGGFTTLAALTATDVFSAGTSYYGISDLLKLYDETHFFERGYLDFLIGSIVTNRTTYEKRSPINKIESITSPVLIFQGSEDTVVPLNQSREMSNALMNRGIESRLVIFEGEGHSFSKPENRKTALELELQWYLQIFNLTSGSENT